ncbi:hypothetical protein L218DRAFT_395005 [Marasmius fiardii PR-910]|nr:hypothetical protein L218DRAFT_395005 [Marasmius fiardii PR-910]
MYRNRVLKGPYPVSLGTPTPKERAAEAQLKRDIIPWDAPRIPLFPSQSISNDPRLTIQVEFYSHLTKIQRRTLPDMQGSVALEPDGSLDVRKLMLLWGLENCAPVNPETLIPMYTFELRRANIIPRPAVLKLIHGKRRGIAFLECEDVTNSTARKRQAREIYWTFRTAISTLYNVFAGMIHDLLFPLVQLTGKTLTTSLSIFCIVGGIICDALFHLIQLWRKTSERLITHAQRLVSRTYMTSLYPVQERYRRLLRCLYIQTGIAEAVRECAQLTNTEGTLVMVVVFGVIVFGFWSLGRGF